MMANNRQNHAQSQTIAPSVDKSKQTRHAKTRSAAVRRRYSPDDFEMGGLLGQGAYAKVSPAYCAIEQQ